MLGAHFQNVCLIQMSVIVYNPCFITELLEGRANLQQARSGKTECYSVSMVVCSLLDKEKGMLGPQSERICFSSGILMYMYLGCDIKFWLSM